MTTADLITRYNPCKGALEWARDNTDPEQAWAGLSRSKLVLLACACARLALPHVPVGEDRPRVAIETAEAWSRGGPDAPSIADVRRASYAANAAANAGNLHRCAEIIRMRVTWSELERLVGASTR